MAFNFWVLEIVSFPCAAVGALCFANIPCSVSSHIILCFILLSMLQSGQRSFSLTFPKESQDLYGNSTLPELGPTQYKQTEESQ